MARSPNELLAPLPAKVFAVTRPQMGRRTFKAIFATIILVLSFTAPAAAGPVEDALATRDSGDYATALRFMRPLADQGDAIAQVTLGAMYIGGEGVPQDDAEAVKWFRLAADQGVADAQSVLAFMYMNGRGVPQSDVEAVKWFGKAADQGNARAQDYLEEMYSDGHGAQD